MLQPNTPVEGDRFGHSVAIDIETVFAGVAGDDDKGAASGSVYVMRLHAATADFTQDAYAASSGDTQAAIPVELGVTAAQYGSVNYATSDGTAQAGRDYTAASGILTFSPRQTKKNFSVGILNGQGGTVNLTLSNPEDVLIGPINPATLTIPKGSGGAKHKVYLPFVRRRRNQ